MKRKRRLFPLGRVVSDDHAPNGFQTRWHEEEHTQYTILTTTRLLTDGVGRPMNLCLMEAYDDVRTNEPLDAIPMGHPEIYRRTRLWTRPYKYWTVFSDLDYIAYWEGERKKDELFSTVIDGMTVQEFICGHIENVEYLATEPHKTGEVTAFSLERVDSGSTVSRLAKRIVRSYPLVADDCGREFELSLIEYSRYDSDYEVMESPGMYWQVTKATREDADPNIIAHWKEAMSRFWVLNDLRIDAVPCNTNDGTQTQFVISHE